MGSWVVPGGGIREGQRVHGVIVQTGIATLEGGFAEVTRRIVSVHRIFGN